MTVIERKKRIKSLIDKISEEHLDEAFMLLEDLSKKDKKQKAIVKELLESEKSLFERLAQWFQKL